MRHTRQQELIISRKWHQNETAGVGGLALADELVWCKFDLGYRIMCCERESAGSMSATACC